MGFILACDAGTTSSRTLIFDQNFEVQAQSQKEFTQFMPQPSWVEHDAEEIWTTQYKTIQASVKALAKKFARPKIQAIGITNQRETIVAWDKITGQSLAPALVWQDQRTEKICIEWTKQGHAEPIRKRTGLILNPYFSASKIQWLLENNKAVQKAYSEKRLCLGTVDSWLIYKLTQGESHVTDPSNASRTMLMNIHTGDYDVELCRFFGVDIECLPEIVDSNANFGVAQIAPLKGVPITGVLGDQQASLFGHGALLKGQAKNTYGTGCFALKNAGKKSSWNGSVIPEGILETIAWRIQGQTTYAHEGAVMIGGAAVQFLRDNLGIIQKASETEALAQSLTSNDDVYFVPAFSGLGTPWWDSQARGVFVGLTRQTTKAHMARSALEAIAFQSLDLLKALGVQGPLKVDGGATANQFLMQFQADIYGRDIQIATMNEVTALGVAKMAALGAGLIRIQEVKSQAGTQIVSPKMKLATKKHLVNRWLDAVDRSRQWNQN